MTLPSPRRSFGLRLSLITTMLAVVGALGAFVVGNAVSLGVLDVPAFGAGAASAGDPRLVGNPLLLWGCAPFLVLLALLPLAGRPWRPPAGR